MAESTRPSNKVTAGALAGAVTAIAAWVSKTYGHVELPPEIAIAASVVVTFIVQYLVPDATQEPPP